MEEGEECLCPGNGNRLDKFTIEKAEAKTLDFGSVAMGLTPIVFEQLCSSEQFNQKVFERIGVGENLNIVSFDSFGWIEWKYQIQNSSGIAKKYRYDQTID